jgi:3-oxocholest-4-en-26-oyl-CoA dehydrogenase beta subunit
MDFDLTEQGQALADIADRILGDKVTPERLKALEADGGAVFDAGVWRALADAGVSGALVPAEHGGAGLGIADLTGVLEAAGASVAPVPFVQTLVLGALPIARYGSPAQQAALLPGVADGSVVLTAALEEPHPVAEETAGGWRLTGELMAVSYGTQAARIVVAARVGEDRVLLLLDPSAEGVGCTELLTTNRQPTARLTLERAPAQLLTDAPGAVDWVTQAGAAAWCAVQAGVCERALRMTATHTANRRQFDKPIAEFQAVAQRAADAFIDTEMVRLTARQALFRLGQGWPAANEVHVAKFWAGDGGMRVVHAAQHLHGGLGVDVDYPLHRYFFWAKQIEHTLGTPTRELIRLGAALADEPV